MYLASSARRRVIAVGVLALVALVLSIAPSVVGIHGDAEAISLIDQVKVGNDPEGAPVDHVTRRVFVADRNSSGPKKVYQIDGAANPPGASGDYDQRR